MTPGAALLTLSLTIGAGDVKLVTDEIGGRRVSPSDLAAPVERLVLPNGLVVLLHAMPDAESVAVDMTFRAGTIYEPPGRAGMAHLVEHVVFRGFTPDTDYVSMLDRAGVQFMNAFTSAESMSFQLVVPPEALNLALWINTDRLATLVDRLDPSDLRRHTSVVDVERIMRTVDVPYGAVEMAIHRKLFPSPHPLRASVIGRLEELQRTSFRDVRDFVDRYLVPANAVLTIVGNFDPAATKAEIDRTLARLPAGKRAPRPRHLDTRSETGTFMMRERRSRQPRVSVLWRLDGLGQRTRDALGFGGLLLSNYVDGLFGTQVRAGLHAVEGATYFRIDVTLPYDKPVQAAQGEAEVFMRYLTAVDMPRDYLNAMRRIFDLLVLQALDNPPSLAHLLTEMELSGEDPTRIEREASRLWLLNRQVIRQEAWEALVRHRRRLTVHARPINPRQPKLDWESRQEASR